MNDFQLLGTRHGRAELTNRLMTGALVFSIGVGAAAAAVKNSQNIRDLVVGDRWVTGKVSDAPKYDHGANNIRYEFTTNEGKTFYGLANYQEGWEKLLPRQDQETRVHLGPVREYAGNAHYRQILEFGH